MFEKNINNLVEPGNRESLELAKKKEQAKKEALDYFREYFSDMTIGYSTARDDGFEDIYDGVEADNLEEILKEAEKIINRALADNWNIDDLKNSLSDIKVDFTKSYNAIPDDVKEYFYSHFSQGRTEGTLDETSGFDLDKIMSNFQFLPKSIDGEESFGKKRSEAMDNIFSVVESMLYRLYSQRNFRGFKGEVINFNLKEALEKVEEVIEQNFLDENHLARENSIDFMEKLGNIAINDEHRLFKEFLPAYEKEINNILNSFCEENKK